MSVNWIKHKDEWQLVCWKKYLKAKKKTYDPRESNIAEMAEETKCDVAGQVKFGCEFKREMKPWSMQTEMKYPERKLGKEY